jgi:hypothetical protein
MRYKETVEGFAPWNSTDLRVRAVGVGLMVLFRPIVRWWRGRNMR